MIRGRGAEDFKRRCVCLPLLFVETRSDGLCMDLLIALETFYPHPKVPTILTSTMLYTSGIPALPLTVKSGPNSVTVQAKTRPLMLRPVTTPLVATHGPKKKTGMKAGVLLKPSMNTTDGPSRVSVATEMTTAKQSLAAQRSG